MSGEEALKKAEFELQHQLELLWYNMGQLEDDEQEAGGKQGKLDAEADKLDKMLVSVDELKELKTSAARPHNPHAGERDRGHGQRWRRSGR